MYCGGGLTEENYLYGVICALKIREATSFSLEKEVYLYPTETAEWMWINADPN